MSRPARKPTLWTLRKVSYPDPPAQSAHAYPNSQVSPTVYFLFQESLLYTSIPLRRDVSARISQRGLRWLIWVDILRSDHNAGFLACRLVCWRLPAIDNNTPRGS